MSIVLADSYPESNCETYRSLNGVNLKVGQSFTAIDGNLDSAKWHIKKVGSPTGNAVATLYSHSGTYGTTSVPNSLLATSDNFDVSTLTTSYQLITFNFSGANKVYMTNGTYYCICLEYTGNLIDYVDQCVQMTAPTHSGNSCFYTTSWNQSPRDAIFYVYEEPPTFSSAIIDSEGLTDTIQKTTSSSRPKSESLSLADSVSVYLLSNCYGIKAKMGEIEDIRPTNSLIDNIKPKT
jgi:hypothetical protein